MSAILKNLLHEVGRGHDMALAGAKVESRTVLTGKSGVLDSCCFCLVRLSSAGFCAAPMGRGPGFADAGRFPRAERALRRGASISRACPMQPLRTAVEDL